VSGDGIANLQGQLTDKREKDYVVRKKGEIEPAFSISRVCSIICWRRGGIGDEEEGCKGTRRGLRKNERGKNDPIYMQQDGNQEDAKRRCFSRY
jgi:hypothetical protein